MTIISAKLETIMWIFYCNELHMYGRGREEENLSRDITAIPRNINDVSVG